MNFDQLYSEYSELVYNLSLSYVHNSEDAQEVTQDVFVKIHRSLYQFKGDSTYKTWIYRITINKSLDFIKSKQGKTRFRFLAGILGKKSFPDPAHFDHPGIQLEHKEQLEILLNQINLLPNKQKTALLLKSTEGLTIKEIAEVMQSTEKAVESLLSRARKNLKNIRMKEKDS